MAVAATPIDNMSSKKQSSKKQKSAPEHQTQGFGVPLTVAPHHFIVLIPRGNRQPVQIIEDLGMHAQDDESEILDRVVISRTAWTQIANPVKRLFNERLKTHNLKTGTWKVGENRVDRLLGKELCVLAWAIEDLEPEKIGTALHNWLALRQEERWWLFGVTATTAGGLNDRGRGWRMALRYALGDTAQSKIQTPRQASKKKQESIQETLPLFEQPFSQHDKEES